MSDGPHVDRNLMDANARIIQLQGRIAGLKADLLKRDAEWVNAATDYEARIAELTAALQDAEEHRVKALARIAELENDNDNLYENRGYWKQECEKARRLAVHLFWMGEATDEEVAAMKSWAESWRADE